MIALYSGYGLVATYSGYIPVLRVRRIWDKVSQLRLVIDRPYSRVQLGDNVAGLPSIAL